MDRDLPEATEQLVDMIARGQLTSSAFRQPFGDPWGGPGPDGNEPRVPTEEEFAASLKRILATPRVPEPLLYGGLPMVALDGLPDNVLIAFPSRAAAEAEFERMRQLIKETREVKARRLDYIVLDHAAPGGTPRTETDRSGRQFVRVQPSVLDALKIVPPEKPSLGMGITGAAGIPVYKVEDLPDGMGVSAS